MTAEQLFEANLNLVYWYVKTHEIYLHGYEREDLEQEASLSLWKSCKTYDPSKGTFATYARKCIDNRFKDLLKIQSRKVEEIPMDHETLDYYEG